MDKPLRILLVEDHLDTLRLMIRVLEAFKHDVKTADSVHSALELAGANDFDLVISDVGLPDGSGVQLMKELNERYGLKGIALTGFEQKAAEDASAGFVAHLTKPISLDRLHDAIVRAAENPDTEG